MFNKSRPMISGTTFSFIEDLMLIEIQLRMTIQYRDLCMNQTQVYENFKYEISVSECHPRSSRSFIAAT